MASLHSTPDNLRFSIDARPALRAGAAVLAAAGILALTFSSAASAQAYPNRPIRLIVPFAAGGGSDFVGRLIGQKLTEQLGQQVIVDNRPGAASLVGTEIAAKGAPDGYTLLLADSGYTINIAFYKNAKYDPLKDFEPVSVIAETPYILVAQPNIPGGGTLKELIALAKANPGKYSIGSAGNGSGTHLSGELFRLSAGINMIHVPYKSVGGSIADVVGGQIHSTMTSLAPALPLVKAGRLKVMGAAASKRHAVLPDVPTFAEAGVKDVVVTNWYSVIATGGTPPAVVKRLEDEIHKAVATPEFKERLQAVALDPAPNTPEQFRKMIAGEVARWKRVMGESGIKQE